MQRSGKLHKIKLQHFKIPLIIPNGILPDDSAYILAYPTIHSILRASLQSFPTLHRLTLYKNKHNANTAIHLYTDQLYEDDQFLVSHIDQDGMKGLEGTHGIVHFV